MSDMCAKHAAEHAAWRDPSPETFRALGGRSGITFVAIGKMTSARMQMEHKAFVDRAYKALRDQLEMIKRFCAEGAHCSSNLADMWTANGDGVKPEPTIETKELP